MRNVVSPIVSIEYGNRTARGGDRQAGMGSRRKQKPCCNGADRGSRFAPRESGQTSERSFFTRKSENGVETGVRR